MAWRGKVVVFPIGMALPQRLIEGYLLAAAIAEEGESSAAAGLHDFARSAILRAAARLRALEPAVRRRELRRIASLLRETPDADAVLPPRARAILARDVPKEIGRAWLASAPPPRRGFAAGAAIREVVRRAACAASTRDRAAREVAELREAGCRA